MAHQLSHICKALSCCVFTSKALEGEDCFYLYNRKSPLTPAATKAVMMTASPGGSWSLAEPVFQDSTFPISRYSPGLRKEMNPLQLPMLLQIYLLAVKQHIIHRKRVWQVNEARGQSEMPWMSSSALRQCSYGAVSKPVRFQEEINWNYFWHHSICEPYCGAPSPGTPECVRDDLFFDKHEKKNSMEDNLTWLE